MKASQRNVGRIECGRVEIHDGGCLVYKSDILPEWTISTDEIAVVGEYTNEDGPSNPDYFYVFVRASGEWHRLPVCAVGIDEAVQLVANRLGFEPEGKLFHRPTFDSRIIWPAVMSGKPLLLFVEHRAWWTWLWPGPMWTGLSDEVMAFLPNASVGE